MPMTATTPIEIARKGLMDLLERWRRKARGN